jgi:hypothetical protein
VRSTEGVVDGRSVVAKDVNRHILAVARDVEAADHAPSELMTFMCECGCMQEVQLTVAHYIERGGAMIAGHEATSASAKRLPHLIRRLFKRQQPTSHEQRMAGFVEADQDVA